MSAFYLPTNAQLTETCDSVQTVLDSLRDHNNSSLNNRARTLSPVKNLFKSLQRLEDDASRPDGAFHSADVRARHNITGVLTSCGVVAAQLRRRIHCNSLSREDGLVIELISLTNDVDDFLKLYKKDNNAALGSKPTSTSTSQSSALVEDLLRKQETHRSEVQGLEIELHSLYDREKSYEQEIAHLSTEIDAKDTSIAELENHNDAKLCHIRRLHAAIANLGLRHSLNHQTYDWDDLTDELPAMVLRIEKINEKLKELEVERDRLNEQEQHGDEDFIPDGMPPVPDAPSAANGSEPPSKDKQAKRKDNRRVPEGKPFGKVRSPSPVPSNASKPNTGKSIRRKVKGSGSSILLF